MIKAFLIYTGDDGHSHIKKGYIPEGAVTLSERVTFSEYPPNYVRDDWHTAPFAQYVITLSGVIQFTTKTGESCIVYPGDVLLATDLTGSGHHWKALNSDPWKRIYVVYKTGEDTHFEEEVLS